jgi:hypothetical protein
MGQGLAAFGTVILSGGNLSVCPLHSSNKKRIRRMKIKRRESLQEAPEASGAWRGFLRHCRESPKAVQPEGSTGILEKVTAQASSCFGRSGVMRGAESPAWGPLRASGGLLCEVREVRDCLEEGGLLSNRLAGQGLNYELLKVSPDYPLHSSAHRP